VGLGDQAAISMAIQLMPDAAGLHLEVDKTMPFPGLAKLKPYPLQPLKPRWRHGI
jgi:hypothetical protein